MKCLKIALIFLLTIFVLGIFAQTGFTQFLLGPLGLPWIGSSFYSPFLPFGGPYIPTANIFPPFYGGSLGWGIPFGPLISPVPTQLSPFQRRPNATIIFTSPTLTAVSAAPGVILVGATGVLGAPTVVVPTAAVAASIPTPVTAANPAPAPLFSLLSVLYASATLDGKALLSTANPLLFAYLTTLVF
jgi:hypothetical protein